MPTVQQYLDSFIEYENSRESREAGYRATMLRPAENAMGVDPMKTTRRHLENIMAVEPEDSTRYKNAKRKMEQLDALDNAEMDDTVQTLPQFTEPEPVDNSPAVPLSEFAIPCGGLVDQRLPDSGKLGERIRPQSSSAAKSAILGILSKRERFPRFGRK